MKKILIATATLLLLITFGCSSEDEKTSSEKAKDTIIEAAKASKEAAVEAQDQAVEMGNDAVKATKKKAEIEGC